MTGLNLSYTLRLEKNSEYSVYAVTTVLAQKQERIEDKGKKI